MFQVAVVDALDWKGGTGWFGVREWSYREADSSHHVADGTALDGGSGGYAIEELSQRAVDGLKQREGHRLETAVKGLGYSEGRGEPELDRAAVVSCTKCVHLIVHVAHDAADTGNKDGDEPTAPGKGCACLAGHHSMVDVMDCIGCYEMDSIEPGFEVDGTGVGSGPAYEVGRGVTCCTYGTVASAGHPVDHSGHIGRVEDRYVWPSSAHQVLDRTDVVHSLGIDNWARRLYDGYYAGTFALA